MIDNRASSFLGYFQVEIIFRYYLQYVHVIKQTKVCCVGISFQYSFSRFCHMVSGFI